jgi:DNA-directed RNA polymerase subunit RPC12/RpoP
MPQKRYLCLGCGLQFSSSEAAEASGRKCPACQGDNVVQASTSSLLEFLVGGPGGG